MSYKNNEYSKVFQMDRTELRKYLRNWERDNLPSNRKDKSVYDVLKELKQI